VVVILQEQNICSIQAKRFQTLMDGVLRQLAPWEPPLCNTKAT
jgi:hypothetical protein